MTAPYIDFLLSPARPLFQVMFPGYDSWCDPLAGFLQETLCLPHPCQPTHVYADSRTESQDPSASPRGTGTTETNPLDRQFSEGRDGFASERGQEKPTVGLAVFSGRRESRPRYPGVGCYLIGWKTPEPAECAAAKKRRESQRKKTRTGTPLWRAT